MQLHEVLEVKETKEPGVYIVISDITDITGSRYISNYVSRPDDPYGLGPAVREAVDKWIAEGKPITAYEPNK